LMAIMAFLPKGGGACLRSSSLEFNSRRFL
jgi:hypothetical protein